MGEDALQGKGAERPKAVVPSLPWKDRGVPGEADGLQPHRLQQPEGDLVVGRVCRYATGGVGRRCSTVAPVADDVTGVAELDHAVGQPRGQRGQLAAGDLVDAEAGQGSPRPALTSASASAASALRRCAKPPTMTWRRPRPSTTSCLWLHVPWALVQGRALVPSFGLGHGQRLSTVPRTDAPAVGATDAGWLGPAAVSAFSGLR